MKIKKLLSSSYFSVLFIIVFAAALRIIFFTGHVFSDDAYYSYLSYSLLKGNFATDYLGYPIFLLRMGQIALTAVSFYIYSANEISSIFVPFLFSLLNILLVYKTALLIFNNKSIGVISAFLVSIFPTDIVFSTCNFSDLTNAFVINLGVYFLLKSLYKKEISSSVLSGIFLSLSLLFKEQVYFFIVLLLIVFIYFSSVKDERAKFIFIPLFITGLFFISEGIIYYFVKDDLLYRLHILNKNYLYSYYDFFPTTTSNLIDSSAANWQKILVQIFLINVPSVFFRRFYLFIPLIALYQSVKNIKRKEFHYLTVWFLGYSLLMIGFTSSFISYKPLDLHRSWYIYPLILPSVILTALFLNKLKLYTRYSLIILFIIFSFVMTKNYSNYFDLENLKNFKHYLFEDKSQFIWTDHFTKYSIDLLKNYKENNVKIFDGNNFSPDNMNRGDLFIYNKKHLDELVLQGYKFVNFNLSDTDKFILDNKFGDYSIYKIADKN